MTQTEALKLALDWAYSNGETVFAGGGMKAVDGMNAWTKAIREALAQPEQTNTRPYYTIDELNAWADEKEKQAWRNAAIRIGEELSSVGPDGYYEMDAWKWLDWAMEQEPRGKNSVAQPEQEPVAWLITDEKINSLQVDSIQRLIDRARHAHMTDIKLRINGQDEWFQADWLKHLTRTTPPQRKPLTDEDIVWLVPGLLDCLCDPYDYNKSGDSHASIRKDMIRLARAIEAAHGIKENT